MKSYFKIFSKIQFTNLNLDNIVIAFSAMSGHSYDLF
jgi:hypothetical protein